MTTEKPPASLLCNQDPLTRPHPALDHNPLAYDPPSTPSPAPSLRPFHTPYVINAAVHFLLLLVSGLFSPVAPRWLVVSKGFAQIFLNNENATIPRFIFFSAPSPNTLITKPRSISFSPWTGAFWPWNGA